MALHVYSGLFVCSYNMYMLKSIGPKNDACGTPSVIDLITSILLEEYKESALHFVCVFL